MTPACGTVLLERVLLQLQPLELACYGLDKLHLTVKFLGLVNVQAIDDVITAAENVLSQTSSFTVELKRFELFKPRKRPPILIALTNLPLPLAKLYSGLNGALQPLGYAMEQRAFRPHITLSRQAADIVIVKDNLDLQFAVNGFCLYASEQGSYTLLKQFNFD